MGEAVLRPLRAEEFEVAHGILVGAAEWLTAKGIRQWTAAYPKELYRAHQAKGWNHGLRSEGQLAAILTLSCERPDEWADCIGTGPVWWLSKLATAASHRGRGLGALAVRQALGVVSANGADRLYLDCVHGTGVLVDFYQRLGFKMIDRRNLKFSTGLFDMVLMEAVVRTTA